MTTKHSNNEAHPLPGRESGTHADSQNRQLVVQRAGRRLADNWRRGYAAHLQLRREYRADGEWSLWATSYAFAPMFWLLVAVFSIYATSKGQPESPTAKLTD